eukprot:scaffold347212_cov41-Attheya_sp.AAC.1
MNQVGSYGFLESRGTRGESRAVERAQHRTQGPTTTRRQQRELGRSIRKLSGKGFHSLLSLTTTSQVPTVSANDTVTFHPEYTVHTDKGPMERASLNEYSRRLHMAKGSPLMVSPLVQEVGYLGVSTQSQQILDGTTYTPPPGVDPYTDKWLSQLGWACPEAD